MRIWMAPTKVSDMDMFKTFKTVAGQRAGRIGERRRSRSRERRRSRSRETSRRRSRSRESKRPRLDSRDRDMSEKLKQRERSREKSSRSKMHSCHILYYLNYECVVVVWSRGRQ